MRQNLKLVLVRGLGRESFHWGEFITQLQSAFPNASIETLDVMGNGPFYELQSQFGIKKNVDWLRNQLFEMTDKISINPTQSEEVVPIQPRLLIGLSLGGMLVSHWAHLYPQEVSGLVVMNSSFANFSAFKRMQPAAMLNLIQILRTKNPSHREKMILDLTCNLRSDRLALAQIWGARAMLYPAKPINIIKQLILAGQMTIPQLKSGIPVLVLNGEKDRLVDPFCSSEIARLWKTNLSVHSEAGHDLPLDDGPWVVEEIKNWLLNH